MVYTFVWRTLASRLKLWPRLVLEVKPLVSTSASGLKAEAEAVAVAKTSRPRTILRGRDRDILATTSASGSRPIFRPRCRDRSYITVNS